ncbi:MAG: hypothetical protein IKZ62_08220 [Prevotella sp.]|nr:hypothetical protein [Prevotella sp.]
MKKSILFLMMLLAATTVSAQDIFDRLDNALGVSLSAEYKNIMRNNETMQKVLLNDDGFTEQFIKEQMKEDWGISKDNQYLFIWSNIYHRVTREKFYDFLNDENKSRKIEYAKNSKKILTFSDNYENGIINYMQRRSAEAKQRSAEAKQRSAEAKQRSAEAKQRSAEAKQRSAEAKQRSAEAKQRSAEAKQRSAEYRQEIVKNLNYSLNEMRNYYNYWKKDPSLISKKDIEDAKSDAARTIKLCKEYNIDYKSILSSEAIKFYGIE